MSRKLALAALLVSMGMPALAQRTTGTISGVAKDSSGAVLPGVTVTITGPNVVGAQSAVTNELGFYRVLNLPPGDYNVSFGLAGFKTLTRTGVRVSLGLQLEENASLEVSQLQEEVTVVAESPVVDTTTNEVGSNYDRSWVENAPLRRFSFFDLVAAAPGSLQGGDGSDRTMVYGSGYDENAFQVDGVDITDNFFNEPRATQTNTDAIEEVEVLSLGAPAEYGNLTGAVYNIVTRQGTNEFHGDVNFYIQTDGLTSNNTNDLKNPDGSFVDACGDARCPWTRDDFTDFTAQLGGPIFKDKLWFFGSYGRQRDSLWDVGIPSTGAAATAARKANEVDRYFFKLTWQANAKHKFVGTFQQDDQSEDNGLDIGYEPSTAWTRKANTPTPGLAYTGVLSDKTVVDVRFSGFYGTVSGGPTDTDQPRDLPRFYDVDTGIISGGHYYWYEVEPRRTTVTGKISHLADNFLGSTHDFRFGVQYSGAVAKGIYGYNDLIFTYNETYPGYGYGYDRQPFSYSGNSRNLGFFFDDTVRLNDRLSLNVGLRYDHNKAFSAEQDEVDQFGQPTGTSYPQKELYTWSTFSPRLGFNLKLTGDGRTVLKGHYGRYHRPVATGEYANVIGDNVKPTFAGGYDTTTGQFVDLSFFEGNTNLSVDPDYRSPKTDQFILSLERELFKGFGTNINYVYKRGRDLQGWEDTAGEYVQVPFTDDLGENPTNRTFPVYSLVSDPGARQFRITNPSNLKSDVHAVSLGFMKRMTGRWQLNASVTWLRAEGLLQESASGVTIQQRSGLQFRDFGKNPNAYVNTDGRLPLDVTWNFKAQVVYKLPAGFLVSANFSHRDNAWLVRRGRVPVSVTNIPETTTILLQKRGENGRLPDVTFLDFRLQKDFSLGKNVHFSIFADALNLINENAPESVQSSIATSSVFLWPLDPVDPRRIMLGAKLRF